MSWFREIGVLEYGIILLFIVLYSLFVSRLFRIGKTLGSRPMRIWGKAVLRTAVLILLVIALLGPSFGSGRKEVKSVGKDIMICIDLSKSMDAFDVQPSRLEKVKFEMKRIIEAFNSDRLGIIIFSSESFIQCPLTFDQNALNLMVESLNTGLVPNAGTDFAPALKMAAEKFKTDAGNKKNSQRIVILVSDGEDFGEETSDAAKALEDEGVALYALGIGTAEGSAIRTARGLKTDRNGATVISRINSDAMRSLAKSGGGSYFEINAERNDVPRLINAINSIEGELRESRQVDVSANRYFYFLLAAAMLFLIDALIPLKTLHV